MGNVTRLNFVKLIVFLCDRAFASEFDGKMRKPFRNVHNESVVYFIFHRFVYPAEMYSVFYLVGAFFIEIQSAVIYGIIAEEQFYVFKLVDARGIFTAKASYVQLQKVGFGRAGFVIQYALRFNRHLALSVYPGQSRLAHPVSQLINVGFEIGFFGFDFEHRDDVQIIVAHAYFVS